MQTGKRDERIGRADASDSEARDATRAAMLADRAQEQRSRVPRFTPMPARRSLSTRGERAETWRTKRHTPARLRDIEEARKQKLATKAGG